MLFLSKTNVAQLVEREAFKVFWNLAAGGSIPPIGDYPYSLEVRISPFQGENVGSIPARGGIFCQTFFFVVLSHAFIAVTRCNRCQFVIALSDLHETSKKNEKLVFFILRLAIDYQV